MVPYDVRTTTWPWLYHMIWEPCRYCTLHSLIVLLGLAPSLPGPSWHSSHLLPEWTRQTSNLNPHPELICRTSVSYPFFLLCFVCLSVIHFPRYKDRTICCLLLFVKLVLISFLSSLSYLCNLWHTGHQESTLLVSTSKMTDVDDFKRI